MTYVTKVAARIAAVAFELPDDDDEEEEVDLDYVKKQVVSALSSVAKKEVLRLDDLEGWTIESDGGKLFAVQSDGPAKKKFPIEISVSAKK